MGTLALVLYGALRGERSYGVVTEIAVALLGIVFILLVAKNRPMGVTFYGAFADDAFTRFMSALALIGSLVTLLLSIEFMRKERIGGFEFPILILLVDARHADADLGQRLHRALSRPRADEPCALRHRGLSAPRSARHRGGPQIFRARRAVVGHAALRRLADLRLRRLGLVRRGRAAVQGHANIGVLFGLVFVLAGLAFKISAVPFHMWTPDVYEGAPTPVTTFFASAPKIAAMAILVRVAITAFPGITSDWRQIFTFVSIASMALGAFAAIGQTNFKRLMAYSSIGHMGFALVGLAAGTVEGRAERHRLHVDLCRDDARDLRRHSVDAARRQGGRDDRAISRASRAPNSTMAFFLAAMMFSLAGVPPLAGFFAKFYVFAAAIKAGLYGLAVIGVLASAVGAYYYLRIVKLMYFDEPAKAFDRPGPVARTVLAVAALLIVLFVFAPSPLTNAAMAAAQSLF